MEGFFLTIVIQDINDASMELDGNIYPLHVFAQAGDSAGLEHVRSIQVLAHLISL